MYSLWPINAVDLDDYVAVSVWQHVRLSVLSLPHGHGLYTGLAVYRQRVSAAGSIVLEWWCCLHGKHALCCKLYRMGVIAYEQTHFLEAVAYAVHSGVCFIHCTAKITECPMLLEPSPAKPLRQFCTALAIVLQNRLNGQCCLSLLSQSC